MTEATTATASPVLDPLLPSAVDTTTTSAATTACNTTGGILDDPAAALPSPTAAQAYTSNSFAAKLLTRMSSLMEKAKEKWDASGGNEAVARASAKIPDNVKIPFKQFCDSLSVRAHMRSAHVFLGVGEKRPFYLEVDTSGPLQARYKHNLHFFFSNYMLMTAFVFALTLFLHPSAVLSLLFIAAAWIWLIRNCDSTNASRNLRIMGKSIPQKNAVFGLSVITCLVLLFLLAEVFWWAFFASGFLTILHAGLRDASMQQHKATDAGVARSKSGDLSEQLQEETEPFLNEPKGGENAV